MQGLEGPAKISSPYNNLHVWHLVSTDYVHWVQEEEVTTETIPLLASERASRSKLARMGSVEKHLWIDSKKMIMTLYGP